MTTTGHNSSGHNGTNEELLGIVKRIADDLADIDDAKTRVKEALDAAKNDGWDVKVLRKIIKEFRAGPDFQAECLEAEEVLDTYRRGAGLPTTLETAQAAAREATAVIPEPKTRERRRRQDIED